MSVRVPVLSLALFALGVSPCSAASLSTVLLKGDPAPVAGAEYRKFSAPAVGDASGGTIAFRGTARAESGTKGLFGETGTSAGEALAVRGETPLGFSYRNFRKPSLNAAGDAAWFAFVTPQKMGVFRNKGSLDTKIVVLAGEPTPLGGTYDEMTAPSLTESGQVVFGVEIDDGSVEFAVLRCSGGDGACSGGTGSLDVLVKSGDPISDRPGREVCEFADSIAASNWGIAFLAETKTNCSSNSELPKDGIFRKSHGGALQTVAMEGEFASAGGSGATYQSFRDLPELESSGKVTFLATAVGSESDTAIFLCPASGCSGTPAQAVVIQSHLDDEANLVRKLSRPHIDNAGDISFHASVKGVDVKGDSIYIRRSGGALDRIITKREPVPDMPGAIFKKIGRHAMSPGGRIAFTGKIGGEGGYSGPAQFLYEP